MLLIDEVQSADDESLRVLAHAWQEMASEPDQPRAGLFCVGLPGSEDHIIKAVTFSERFDFEPLFGIDETGSIAALVGPAQELGVMWDRDAIASAVELADGYPYKIQLIGDEAWTAARWPDSGGRITRSHVDAAMEVVDRKMRTLMAARWRLSSTKQRELLVAMAELGGKDVRRDELAGRLGKTSTEISMPRDALLQKGIVDASRHGRLSFTVPGFTEYVLSQR